MILPPDRLTLPFCAPCTETNVTALASLPVSADAAIVNGVSSVFSVSVSFTASTGAGLTVTTDPQVVVPPAGSAICTAIVRSVVTLPVVAENVIASSAASYSANERGPELWRISSEPSGARVATNPAGSPSTPN